MSTPIGPMVTKRTPRSTARCMPPRVSCSVMPPYETWQLRSGSPPKLTTSRAPSAISFQVVCSSSMTCHGATTCGRMTCAAAVLYEFTDRVQPPMQFRKRCSCDWA